MNWAEIFAMVLLMIAIALGFLLSASIKIIKEEQDKLADQIKRNERLVDLLQFFTRTKE